ncbi:helix-turn-helix domain-containing protein [Nonomuraea sp. SMC257]|uniref:Helix-turn-helix domain-containing protein n=2 Tax=Nonomuraea montanisoli TaxID=2741721 RepID=A0A7Y6I364_9ACTN|nr:helix-turn-helix domain-containing protein [Nonomuraea montanisoli]
MARPDRPASAGTERPDRPMSTGTGRPGRMAPTDVGRPDRMAPIDMGRPDRSAAGGTAGPGRPSLADPMTRQDPNDRPSDPTSMTRQAPPSGGSAHSDRMTRHAPPHRSSQPDPMTREAPSDSPSRPDLPARQAMSGRRGRPDLAVRQTPPDGHAQPGTAAGLAAPERLGIGRAVPVLELPESWRSARLALRLTAEGTDDDPGPRVVYADDLGALELLAAAVDPGTWKDVPDVRALDRAAGAAPWMLATLHAVAGAVSLRAAAAELTVHHSTLLDRLVRAEHLLGWSVRTPQGRVRLHLAFAVRRLLRHPDQLTRPSTSTSTGSSHA